MHTHLSSTASFCVLAALAAPVSGFAAAPAADYPNRPLRLIVPYPAGGPNDVLARLTGGKLTELWNQPVVIDNRPGAGGNLAVEVTARAEPDGYTMVLHAIAYAVNPTLYSKVPYRFDQFTPVSIVAKGPLVLVAHPSLNVNTVKELIALAKAKPGQLQYASGGNGSSLHLAGEMFKIATGVDLVHIPYKGTNEFIPDLLAGRVPLSFASPLIMAQHVKAGRIKALGVTSLKRAKGWDVPAIAETVPGFEMDAWYAILVPAKTPKDVVNKLSATINKGLNMPDVADKMAGLGVEPVGGTPQQAAVYIDAEIKKWSQVLKTAGIKAD